MGEEEGEEEEEEARKLINKKENTVVRINISGEDAIMDAETERYLTEVDQERITKEQDEEIMKIKQRQIFLDDVGVTVAMIAVTLLAVSVVVLKVIIFSDKIDPNVSTFIPLDQQIKSKIKYTGNGFIPCEGFLPCSEDYSGG